MMLKISAAEATRSYRIMLPYQDYILSHHTHNAARNPYTTKCGGISKSKRRMQVI